MMDRCSFVANFYPRPPRGGRPASFATGSAINLISIHALREEGDRSPWKSLTFPRYFYPRPPRGGRPALSACCFRGSLDFYPRPPRGGRRCVQLLNQRIEVISIHALREEGDFIPSIFAWCIPDFYPRPPRGGRPYSPDSIAAIFSISIHALREEGDLRQNQSESRKKLFLSTPSARRATLDGFTVRFGE